jgi:hypothetical protein
MDLALCRVLGLSYADVRALPRAVYEIAIEDLTAAATKARDAAPAEAWD